MDYRPTGPSRAGEPDAPRDDVSTDRPDAPPSPVTYRIRPAVGIRLIGAGCVWLCLPVMLEVLRRTVPATDIAAVGVLRWLGVAVFALITLTGTWILLDPRRGLRLTVDGFSDRTRLRAPGRSSARWLEVSGVEGVHTDQGPALGIELRDGTTRIVPGSLLDTDLGTVAADMQQRLDHAHGYRPL